ncbi:hypothetical protein C9W97_26200, partial [Salmonella enterica subsp. enterica serovar Enteritidis]|nr:hypothetical protein [Salmonella enterica subsp. enterica serovar Enteritidis]
MGQILVRQLDDAIVTALKARAKANARSTEAELREIISNAVRPARTTLASLIGSGRSATSFGSSEEIVAHVKALRDEWER